PAAPPASKPVASPPPPPPPQPPIVGPALVASVCAYSGNVSVGCYESTSWWDMARKLVEEWDIILTEHWFEVRFPRFYNRYEQYKMLSTLLDTSVNMTADRLRMDARRLSPFDWPD